MADKPIESPVSFCLPISQVSLDIFIPAHDRVNHPMIHELRCTGRKHIPLFSVRALRRHSAGSFFVLQAGDVYALKNEVIASDLTDKASTTEQS